MIKISAVIITYNEEKNIGRCIDSLAGGLVDEVVVLDSFSTDATRKICEEKGAKFFQRTFEGHIQQKNHALTYATYDHILSLDADEYLSPELRKSIEAVKAQNTHQAYSMNRLSSLRGRWIYVTDWYPDRKIRLWNKQVAHWGGYNPHDKLVVKPGIKVKHLDGNILHVAYDSVDELFRKAYLYASLFAQGNRHKVGSSTFKILYKTFFSFFRNYFMKLGFAYGFDGLAISMSIATYTFAKYAILKDLNSRKD
jgi:glycosyltransferase involved in cell wall biosynthesis